MSWVTKWVFVDSQIPLSPSFLLIKNAATKTVRLASLAFGGINQLTEALDIPWKSERTGLSCSSDSAIGAALPDS